MKTINEVTQALSADRFLWPMGFPMRVGQSGGKSVSVEVSFGDARPDLVDAFMAQWPEKFSTYRRYPAAAAGDDRELITRIRVVEIEVDLSVFVSAEVFDHLDRTNIKES